MESKAWNWDIDLHDYWKRISDEFLPVALRWKEKKLHRVLDLGCGIGRNALYLASCDFDVFAFDLSESGLRQVAEEAEKNKYDIKIKQGDMLNLPYHDGYFDCILAFHSIYHTDYLGLRRVVSEIKRVLKKDGEIFITLNSKENDAWTSSNHEKVDQYTLLQDETTEENVPHTYLSYQEVLELIADFETLKIQQIFDYWADKKHAHFFINCKK